MGRAVNLANQLLEQAGDDEIFASETTYRLTRNAFRFSPARIRLKETDEPVTVHKVRDLLLVPKKARGFEGLRTDLVGRDEEIGGLSKILI